jgi:hypothetical protein
MEHETSAATFPRKISGESLNWPFLRLWGSSSFPVLLPVVKAMFYINVPTKLGRIVFKHVS